MSLANWTHVYDSKHARPSWSWCKIHIWLHEPSFASPTECSGYLLQDSRISSFAHQVYTVGGVSKAPWVYPREVELFSSDPFKLSELQFWFFESFLWEVQCHSNFLGLHLIFHFLENTNWFSAYDLMIVACNFTFRCYFERLLVLVRVYLEYWRPQLALVFRSNDSYRDPFSMRCLTWYQINLWFPRHDLCTRKLSMAPVFSPNHESTNFYLYLFLYPLGSKRLQEHTVRTCWHTQALTAADLGCTQDHSWEDRIVRLCLGCICLGL